MIFVTLGSQKFQFNRLLEKIDTLVFDRIIVENVFAQSGYSDYLPREYEYKQFLDRDEFNELISKSDTVITHGGTGAIISAVKMGKKVIAVPRLSKFGEHVDDHQVQLLKQFDGMGFIIACFDLNDLEVHLVQSRQAEVKKYISNTDQIIESIELHLRKLCKE